MKIYIPFTQGLSLQITSNGNGDTSYPTAAIRKGLVLFYAGQDLSEEAVGFGVPILKRGRQAIFPGEVILYPHAGYPVRRISASYKLNLEEKISHNHAGAINNRFLYSSKNMLAGMIRKWPITRGVLTRTSASLREKFSLNTIYEPNGLYINLSLTYTLDAASGKILVELLGGELIPEYISDVIVMNELGAHYFDQYKDADGNSLLGKQIGCWDEVSALEAEFISRDQQISFSLPQVKGVKLYRGRELIEGRLAWAGFGYSLPPTFYKFSYTITIKR